MTVRAFNSEHFIEMFVYYVHFFSCNSFLCFSFEAEKANHKPANVMATNIIEKINIISPAIDIAISFIPHNIAIFLGLI